MQLEATQAIRDVENLLRDFIAGTLGASLGADWTDACGVTPQRIEQWKQRKETEQQRQKNGSVEPRLIYYADFYDLRTILTKNWEAFSAALGDLKTIDVYLAELEKMRDAGAHGRDLLPHQKQLAGGFVGEIRTRLIRYRSKQETSEDYFPRIESVRDNLGNVWTPETGDGHNRFTKYNLRPDDILDFVVTAGDPLGEELDYRIVIQHTERGEWQAMNIFQVKILDSHISKHFSVGLEIRSHRIDHAMTGYDDDVHFTYTVLPRKRV